MTLQPSQVRKYTRFPKSGSVLSGFDVKEASIDLDEGTWFVMFDGKVSRRQARNAMQHFLGRTTQIPTNTRSFSSPKVVPVTMKCDEVTTVLSNPSGRVTIAKGHLSFDGVLKNPTSAADFHREMNDMVTHHPHKVFRDFQYKKLNDAEFLDTLWSFVTYSGESYGWATEDGKIFHRRASLIMPKIKINKRPDKEVAFYHTHPSKDEPSLTSADDIQFYADLAFAPGVKNNYTVMRDRIDYFRFDVKKRKTDEYLKIDEDHFVQDVDAMIEAGEAKYKDDKDLDPVEFCRLVTQHMVDAFNEKYKGLMKITYKHFVNPNYKGDEGPFPNPLPNPLPNPTNPTIPSKYHHHSLTDLQGVDYSWVHYGGDEFAHTLYTYHWMRYYFEPNDKGISRMHLLEHLGFDSDLRKKTRAYLTQRITGNWTFLDLLFVVGLYHDIGKVREKETKEHHSTAGKYMWDEFIADALDVPSVFEDVVSTMFESDIGRRNISDEFFQTIIGDYYGVALLMQLTDIATHHPTMFVGYAARARKAGGFRGDVKAFKEWSMREKVKKLEKFLDQPLENPRPVASLTTWRGDYGIESVNQDLAFAALNDYRKSGRDEVWSRKQTGSTFYMGFTEESLPELTGMIPEGEEVGVNFWPNSTKIAIFIKESHKQDDFGARLAQVLYESIGEILQGIDPSVKVDKVENSININPRKAKRTKVVLVSGPPGTGKSTFIRYLKHKFPGVGEPLTVTTRPRRPKEKDGVDRIFVTQGEFQKMIDEDQFIEWAKQKNGHYYGRRWIDFKFPVNVVDLNLKGIRAYKQAFPEAYTVFLAPDIPPKSMVKRIMRRGGVTIGEAKRRAALGPTMVAGAKKMEWDQFVKVKSGHYDKIFEGMSKRMGDVLTNPQMTLFGGTVPEPERRAIEKAGDLQPGEDSIHMAVQGISYFSEKGKVITPTVPVPAARFAFLELEALGQNWYKGPVGRVNTARNIRSQFRQELFERKAEGTAQTLPQDDEPMNNPIGATMDDARRIVANSSALSLIAQEWSNPTMPERTLFDMVAQGMQRKYGVRYMLVTPEQARTIPYLMNKTSFYHLYIAGANPGTWDESAGIVYFNSEVLTDRKSLFRELGHETGAVIIASQYGGKNNIPSISPGYALTHGVDYVMFPGIAGSPPQSNPKDLFDWFEEWVHLINMKNKELEAFLDSPLGQKAGLSKKEADEQGIKSGRVSGRRIIKMRAKLGLTGPKDYIKLGPRIIEDYYEKALNNWTGPSDDPLKGETDWDWCKRQVRFVKRHGAFPYNDNQKGPLVREQKTQNQVSRRLLGLWVWGHDPWRWARKHDVLKMPPCPDVPWIGVTEKRKYGKVEVLMNPVDPFVAVNPPKRIKPTELAKKAVNSITKKNYIDRGFFGAVFKIPGTKYVFKVERLAAPEYYAALLSWLAGKGEKPSFPAAQRRVWKYNWDFDAQDFSFPLYAIGDGVSQRYHTIMEYLEADKWLKLVDGGRGHDWSPYDQSKTMLSYLERMASMHQSTYDRFVRNFAKAREHGLQDDGNPANIMIGEKTIHLLDWFWEYGPSEFVTASSFDPYYVEVISGADALRAVRQRLYAYVRYRGAKPKNRPKKGIQARAFRNMTEKKYIEATENYDKCYELMVKVMGKFTRAMDKFDVPLDGRTMFPERDVGAGALSWSERIMREVRPPATWPVIRAKKVKTTFREDQLFDWGLQEVAANPPTPHHGDAIITRQEAPWGTVIIAECPFDGFKGGVEEWMENECNHIYPPCGHVLRINPDKPCCCEKSEHSPVHPTHWPNTRDNPRTAWPSWLGTGNKAIEKEARRAASDPSFKHHEWYIEHHLDYVMALVKHFGAGVMGGKSSQDDLINMVWMHDYPKMVGDKDNFELVRELVAKHEGQDYADYLVAQIEMMERVKTKDWNPETEPTSILANIMSTADALAHYYGPFWQIYMDENTDKTIAYLKKSNREKLEKDKNKLRGGPAPNALDTVRFQYKGRKVRLVGNDHIAAIVERVAQNPRTPEGKKFPQRYLTGLTPLERMIAEDEIDKGYKYDADDPEAYEFWKSDIKATARGLKIGPSKHKEEYYRRYRKNIDKDYKPSGDSPKARFINRITKETGIKRSLIEKVYDKGLAAWRVGHRPGVQQHQWAAGRVYAFVVGADSSTGQGKPDHSLAVEAGVR